MRMSDEQPTPPGGGLNLEHDDSDTALHAVGDQATIDVDGTLVRASVAQTNTREQPHKYLVSYVWPQDRKVHGHWAPVTDLLTVVKHLPVVNEQMAGEGARRTDGLCSEGRS